MWRLILGRLLQAILTIWVVVTIVFAILHVSGDSVSVLASPRMGEQQRAALRHTLGLDQPIYVQYGKFMWGVAHGHLGESFYYDEPALPLVLGRLPVTLKLVALALAIASVIGIPLGIFSAIRADTFIDRLARWISVVGASIPTFFLGVMLIFFFSVALRWLPSSGAGSFSHYIMPATTLSFFEIALFTRMIRSSLLESLQQGYISTARAKGLAEWLVIGRHALRTALIPFTTVFGLQFGQLLAGAVVTETVFAMPGMNRLALNSLFQLDFPVILSYVVVAAFSFCLTNAAVDILYGLLDPRVRDER